MPNRTTFAGHPFPPCSSARHSTSASSTPADHNAGVDASALPPCPEIVAAKFGQVGSNCLLGCEVPDPDDSRILGIIPVCRLTAADAKAFSLAEPAYCILAEWTTFLCTGSDASP